MAVENKYVDSTYINASTGVLTKLAPALMTGAQLGAMLTTFEVAAADDDGSVYRIFPSVNPDLVPLLILVGCDAITGSNDADIGLYHVNGGAVVDKDCFADGLDISSAVDLGAASALDGMDAVLIENYRRRIYEHGAATVATKKAAYDIAVTLNTAGSAAGTVTVLMIYAQG